MILRVFGLHRGAGGQPLGWRGCCLSRTLKDKSEGGPADQRGKVLMYTKARRQEEPFVSKAHLTVT